MNILLRKTAEVAPAASKHGHAEEFHDDDAVLHHWLAIFEHRSPNTARSYRAHVRKFRLFLQLCKPKDSAAHLLKHATEMDLVMFEAAISHQPLPSGQSIRVSCTEGFLSQHGLEICPFEAPMKRSSVNLCMSVLHAMFEFMRKPPGDEVAPYRWSNPAGRVLRRKERAIKQTNRHIPIDGIKALRYFARLRVSSAKNSREKTIAARTCFAVDLLFGMWNRRHEVTTRRISDLRQEASGQWLLSIVRKGGKEDDIPIPDWVMDSLKEYRKACGIEGEIDTRDSTPLLVTGSIANKPRPISDQTLYNDIRSLAQQTAENLAQIAPELGIEEHLIKPMQSRLRMISPHWFRHSGPTIVLNSGLMAVKHVSKMLGHANEATTTGLYFHPDDAKVREGLDAVSQIL